MDIETIQVLLDLLNPLHGSLDKQVMAQITDERELDAPSDREYNIDVTARMERDLTQAVCILEDRKRQATHNQPIRCRWCDEIHGGGPENCGKQDARPAVAFAQDR